MGSEQRKDNKNVFRIEEGQQKGIRTEEGQEKWDQNRGRTTKKGSEHRKDDKNGIRTEEGQ